MQPQHTKELISNIKDRIKFDDIFFKNVVSENRIYCESKTIEVANVDDDDHRKREIPHVDSVQTVETTQQESASDATITPIGVEVENLQQIVLSQHESEDNNDLRIQYIEHKDVFGLININDLDYDIIMAKYKKSNGLSAGDRHTLTHCVMKHIFKSDRQRQ